MHRLFLLLIIFISVGLSARGITPAETEYFEKNVRPVLEDHCIKCHGAKKHKASLRLDSRDAVLKGGDGGPAAVAGKPEESEFVKSIRHEGETKMPEKEAKLPDGQIAALEEWVRMGMPWPEGGEMVAHDNGETSPPLWSLQPILKTAPPEVTDESHWVQSPIDRFILAKLTAAGLSPNPAADRRTLLRRVTFDLTGLPPTMEESDAFVANLSPDAFSKVIDRLLASPRYGERWGRYWLDVARYADTKGYLVGGEERRFQGSYTYRDWVIGAFNDDLPYDQFIIDQIAGDQVATEGDNRAMAALGFITVGRRFLNNTQEIIDDRIDVVCRGIMGLTVACARCHDHKFDPIPQSDYYALYGVFNSSREPQELPVLPDNRDPNIVEEYKRQLQVHLDNIERYKERKQSEQAILLSASIGVPVAVPVDLVEKTFNRLDREELLGLRSRIIGLNASDLGPPRAMALVDVPQPANSRIFLRGNPGRPGEEVPRRFLTALEGGAPKPFEHGSGRLDLAHAIVSKTNPLTARVMANRIWLHHFGAGLVRTPGDFGTKGEPPTHPELLDWLASTFMEKGWSVKQLHRAILLSMTYQQSSDVSEKAALADPENRLLSRMNRQRLDFEAFHDSILFAAGKLDYTMGGRGVNIPEAPFPPRRAVYGYIDRQNLPGIYRIFDFANPDSTTAQRHVTTVPQQALYMMNSAFCADQARSLAASIGAQSGSLSNEQIGQLFARVFSRAPQPNELDEAQQFLAEQNGKPPERRNSSAWEYGWGEYSSETKSVVFHPFAFFEKATWQGGPVLPDGPLRYLSLTPDGGHPGGDNQHSVIRRWVAPRDCTVSITGEVQRGAVGGDGITARIVAGNSGEVAVFNGDMKKPLKTAVKSIQMKEGETLDFIVEPGPTDTSDSFAWHSNIHCDGREWASKGGFMGPPPPALTPLERYAQVLFSTNEFMFVD